VELGKKQKKKEGALFALLFQIKYAIFAQFL
jgi:hypothetical protein